MTADREKELRNLQNRFRDLADKAFQQNIFTFTGFLGLSEQDIFRRMEKELQYAGCVLFGGFADSDRKVLRFGAEKEWGYTVEFPIVCIHIRPLMERFAQELSHRDFLGALLNLGIERSTLGDILVGNKEAYLFCLDSMAEYICENLEQVNHTRVRCELAEKAEIVAAREPVKESVQVSSLRIDAILAKVCGKSRGEVLELFRSGRVFVDGRLCENHSRLLKDGETVNARGFGKFVFTGRVRETRKGKLNVELDLFK